MGQGWSFSESSKHLLHTLEDFYSCLSHACTPTMQWSQHGHPSACFHRSGGKSTYSSLKRTSETPDAVFFPRLRCFHTPHPTCPLHFDNRNNHPDAQCLFFFCCFAARCARCANWAFCLLVITRPWAGC